jgi:hypothetical protein
VVTDGYIIWPNGSTYEGGLDCEGRLAHGQGVHIWPSGDRYNGGWHYGVRHEFGKMYFADGTSWQGEWNMGHHEGNLVLPCDDTGLIKVSFP